MCTELLPNGDFYLDQEESDVSVKKRIIDQGTVIYGMSSINDDSPRLNVKF